MQTDAERLEHIDAKLESMMEHMMAVQAQLMRHGLLPNYDAETGLSNADEMKVGTAEYHWHAIQKKHNDIVTELQKMTLATSQAGAPAPMMPEYVHVSMSRNGTCGHVEPYAFDGSTRYIRDDIFAREFAKTEAIRAVIHRWIDSKERDDTSNGGGMLEILGILYPSPRPTGGIHAKTA